MNACIRCNACIRKTEVAPWWKCATSSWRTSARRLNTTANQAHWARVSSGGPCLWVDFLNKEELKAMASWRVGCVTNTSTYTVSFLHVCDSTDSRSPSPYLSHSYPPVIFAYGQRPLIVTPKSVKQHRGTDSSLGSPRPKHRRARKREKAPIRHKRSLQSQATIWSTMHRFKLLAAPQKCAAEVLQG